MTPQLEQQIKVSRMLSMGFVLTIWPLAWLTSSLSVIIGIWAMGVIKNSKEPMAGRVIAWWCIVAGSLQNLALLWAVTKLFRG